jgi:hypothetical protein
MQAEQSKGISAPPALADMGWDASFEQKMAPYADAGMIPARVVRQDKGIYTVRASRREWPEGCDTMLHPRLICRLWETGLP